MVGLKKLEELVMDLRKSEEYFLWGMRRNNIICICLRGGALDLSILCRDNWEAGHF